MPPRVRRADPPPVRLPADLAGPVDVELTRNRVDPRSFCVAVRLPVRAEVGRVPSLNMSNDWLWCQRVIGSCSWRGDRSAAASVLLCKSSPPRLPDGSPVCVAQPFWLHWLHARGVDTVSNELHYEVMTVRREGVTRDLPEGDVELRWVANSATLIWGERDAVLVDTFTTVEQNERLIEWVRG